MTEVNARGLVDLWLRSPGMREPARVARELGFDPEAHHERIREHVREEELAGWMRAAIRRR